MSTTTVRRAQGRGGQSLAQAVVLDRAGCAGRLTAEQLVGTVRMLATARAHLDSLLLRYVHRLAVSYPAYRRENEQAPPEDLSRPPKDWAREELAAALRVSCWEAGSYLRTAEVLEVGNAPLTAQALTDGLISLGHAQKVARTLDGLPAETARLIDAQLVRTTAVQSLTPTQLGKRAERIRAEVAPEETAERDTVTAGGRYVELIPTPAGEGLTQLAGWLTTEAALALDAALAEFAAPTDEADQRTAGQRRHDALLELALRALVRSPAPERDRSPVTMQVSVALSTLLGGDTPSAATRFGPLGPATVRKMGCTACWQAVITAPDDHTALYLGRTVRAPGRALRRYVLTRDQTCRFPTCTARAERCDVHHVTTWASGGHTDPDNLVLLCGRHHAAVHDTAWTLHRDEGGVCRWTSPAGQVHSVAPCDQPMELSALRRAAATATRRHITIPRGGPGCLPTPPAAAGNGPPVEVSEPPPLLMAREMIDGAWATLGVPLPWQTTLWQRPGQRQPARRRRPYTQRRHPAEPAAPPPAADSTPPPF